MNTINLKNGILQSFYEIIQELSLEEIEDLKDALTAREFKLTDKGERYTLAEVKKAIKKKSSSIE